MTTREPATRIGFVGGLHLGSREVDLEHRLKERLAACDHVVANLESHVYEDSPIAANKMLLRSNPGQEALLSAWGISAVTLANNHMFNQGPEELYATMEALRKRRIRFTGAARDLEQASSPLLIKSIAGRIGILACLDAITQAKLAAARGAGCNPFAWPDIESQVRRPRKTVDFAIVCPHWGYCDFTFPSQQVITQEEALLNAGANLIVGHHSHAIQGIVRRSNGHVVAYSLGDFYFDAFCAKRRIIRPTRESRQGVVLIATLRSNYTAEVEHLYTENRNGIVELDHSKQRDRAFATRCEPLQDLTRYAPFWRGVFRRRCLKRALYWTQVNSTTFLSAAIMLRQMVGWNCPCRAKCGGPQHHGD